MTVPAKQWLERLLAKQDLEETDAAAAMRAMADGSLDAVLAGAVLVALRAKGESAGEIRGFATAMRELARRPEIPPGRPYVDIVGTGGDGSSSLNLSTGAALLAAACGLPVVKHGNRSISSRCGSADVLAALGLPLPLDEHQAGAALAALGFTFLFAPHYHPAMKNIGPVRAALGVRTVFNILGPLANPATPPYHVIGAYDEHMAERMAETLAGMPIERAFVIHGAPGWDEATPVGEIVLFDVRPGMLTESRRTPEADGLQRCAATELLGGDAAHNAAERTRVFRGEDRGAHRDALLMGTSLVLEVQGTVMNAREGVELTAAAIDNGNAAGFLERLHRHFENA